MSEASPFDDLDPEETREWLESMDSVLKVHGAQRAHFLLERLIDFTRRSGTYLPFKPNTAYVNSIPTGLEPEYPGNRALERRLEAYIRWNAMAMVVRANRAADGICNLRWYNGHYRKTGDRRHFWVMLRVNGGEPVGSYRIFRRTASGIFCGVLW